MNDSKEMRELEKLSAGLAPKKSSCQICKVVVVASIVLFIATLALVLLERSNIPATQNAPATNITDPGVKSERIKALRAYLKSQEGTTTTIIVNSPTK